MSIYNKLVRDRIPDMIREDGREYQIRTCTKSEHLELLNAKLGEELQEYLENGELTELADLVEVVYGILYVKGISVDEFERIREAKCEERGGFERGIVLLSAE